MVEWWPAIVFGWPAIILGLSLSVAGIVRRRPIFLVPAIVVMTPFSIYLMGSPIFGLKALAIPLLLAGSAVAVKSRRQALAWLLLLPVVAVIGWLALAVIRQ